MHKREITKISHTNRSTRVFLVRNPLQEIIFLRDQSEGQVSKVAASSRDK